MENRLVTAALLQNSGFLMSDDLLLRGNTYRIHLHVPASLVAILGRKQIRFTARTSDKGRALVIANNLRLSLYEMNYQVKGGMMRNKKGELRMDIIRSAIVLGGLTIPIEVERDDPEEEVQVFEKAVSEREQII